MFADIKLSRYGFRALSRWYKLGPIEVYLRSGPYVLENGALQPALGVANVNVVPEMRQQGHFTRLLLALEELGRHYGYKTLRVEQVIFQGILGHLERNGFERIGEEYPPVYTKRIDAEG